MKAVCKHVALCGLVAAVVSGCDQPKPNCLTAQAPFAMKLQEVSRSGACTAESGPASFNADPEVGVAPYYERDKKGQPDYRKGSIAIRTAELATLLSTYEEHAETELAKEPVLHSIGKFVTEEPDGDDLCRAPDMGTPTHLVLPALAPVPDDPETKADESFDGQDAVDVTLAWSDVAVYVTPASFGTQVRAKLRDTRVTAGGSCTIEYNARGLAPAVPCFKTKLVTDEKGKVQEVPDLLNGKQQVDESRCSPDPVPTATPPRYTGSGIAPDADVVCDPETFFCVLAGDKFPALK